jgi:hypothetical protein
MIFPNISEMLRYFLFNFAKFRESRLRISCPPYYSMVEESSRRYLII